MGGLSLQQRRASSGGLTCCSFAYSKSLRTLSPVKTPAYHSVSLSTMLRAAYSTYGNDVEDAHCDFAERCKEDGEEKEEGYDSVAAFRAPLSQGWRHARDRRLGGLESSAPTVRNPRNAHARRTCTPKYRGGHAASPVSKRCSYLALTHPECTDVTVYIPSIPISEIQIQRIRATQVMLHFSESI